MVLLHLVLEYKIEFENPWQKKPKYKTMSYSWVEAVLNFSKEVDIDVSQCLVCVKNRTNLRWKSCVWIIIGVISEGVLYNYQLSKS